MQNKEQFQLNKDLIQQKIPSNTSSPLNEKTNEKTRELNHIKNKSTRSNAESTQYGTTDSTLNEEENWEPKKKEKRKRKSKSKPGKRRKIKIEFIKKKNTRLTTFHKRKEGILKKAYELGTLTGSEILLLIMSETGQVYTFTTKKMKPIITGSHGKKLLEDCLNAPDLEDAKIIPPEGIDEIDDDDDEYEDYDE